MLRAFLFALVLLLGAPAAGAQNGRAQMTARLSALCNGDGACIARAREAIEMHCGRDRACTRQALQHAERPGDDRSLSDLPAGVRDLVRDLVALRDERASGGASALSAPDPAASGALSRLDDLPRRARERIQQRCGTDPACVQAALAKARDRQATPNPPAPEAALGGSAQDQLNALPPRMQSRIRQRCGTDADCIRDAMEEARDRRQRQAPPPETDPDAPEASGGVREGSGQLGDRALPDGAREQIRSETRRADLGREDESTGRRVRGMLRDDGPIAVDPAVGPAARPEREASSVPDDPTLPEDDTALGPVVYGQGRTTWVSGDQDDRRRTLMAPDGGWLIGIRMGEASDDPCNLSAYFATDDFVSSRHSTDTVTGSGTSEDLGAWFDECGDRGTNVSKHLLAV
ncbi:MAG: hypothetical protein AAFQ43_10685, partial [Bacteroidota bacterium]